MSDTNQATDDTPDTETAVPPAQQSARRKPLFYNLAIFIHEVSNAADVSLTESARII